MLKSVPANKVRMYCHALIASRDSQSLIVHLIVQQCYYIIIIFLPMLLILIMEHYLHFMCIIHVYTIDYSLLNFTLLSLGSTNHHPQVRPLCFNDFQNSMRLIRPSVAPDLLKKLEAWNSNYGVSSQLYPQTAIGYITLITHVNSMCFCSDLCVVHTMRLFILLSVWSVIC